MALVEQSFICKMLESKDLEILYVNGLREDMFLTCEAEVKFIISHYEQYRQMPDKVTFLAQFKDFNMLDVSESVDYLVYKIREAYIYTKVASILQNTADKVREDSITALEFLKGSIADLEANTPIHGNVLGYDIISNAKDRLASYKERCEAKGLIGVGTGIPQLDDITNGWLKGEELVIITGRTNVGKSWIGEYFAKSAWSLGETVLFYSGEMSRDIVGFRFDTLNKHFSNMGLLNGASTLGNNVDVEGSSYTTEDYENYISDLSSKRGFIVVTPDDFDGRKPTVSELKRVAEKVGATMLVVDQISLMSDDKRADTPRIAYNNISEDLFLLSKELKIPVIALAQANREAVKNKKKGVAPELHELAESDGVGQNATRVIALTVIDGTLKLSVKKNRYGINNKDVLMIWDINLGVLKPLVDNPEVDVEMSKEEKDYGF